MSLFDPYKGGKEKAQKGTVLARGTEKEAESAF
jgi:hypothetical protein